VLFVSFSRLFCTFLTTRVFCCVVHLEQFPTSAHIASRMIFTAANTYEDIVGCTVGDLGCGAGMLSIASSLMGSALTIGYDVDEEALDNAWVNCRKLDIFDIDLVQTDVQTLQLVHGKKWVLNSIYKLVPFVMADVYTRVCLIRVRHSYNESSFWHEKFRNRYCVCNAGHEVRIDSLFAA
jgi:hypothetical protein